MDSLFAIDLSSFSVTGAGGVPATLAGGGAPGKAVDSNHAFSPADVSSTGEWSVPTYIGGTENRLLKNLFAQIGRQVGKQLLSVPHYELFHAQEQFDFNDCQNDLSDLLPVFFHGPSFSGKTVLSLTLAGEFSRLFSHVDQPVVYFTGGDFSRQLGTAIYTKTIDSFLSVFQSSPVLVFDNLEELDGHPRAVHEIELICDQANTDHRVVIFSSRVDLLRLSAFAPRLSSRISNGCSVELKLPGKTAQLEIARRLVARSGLIDEARVDQLVSHMKFDDSETRSFVDIRRLLMLSMADVDTVRPGNRQGISRTVMTTPELCPEQLACLVKKVIRHCAKHYSITSGQIIGKGRHRSTRLARNAAIFLIRRLWPISYQQIGQYFSNRDHSTIIHSHRQSTALLAIDAEFSRFIDDAVNRFRPLVTNISTGSGSDG